MRIEIGRGKEKVERLQKFHLEAISCRVALLETTTKHEFDDFGGLRRKPPSNALRRRMNGFFGIPRLKSMLSAIRNVRVDDGGGTPATMLGAGHGLLVQAREDHHFASPSKRKPLG